MDGIIGSMTHHSFNDLEEKVLRFSEAEFLEKGGKPQVMEDPVTYHRDVMAEFNLSPSEYRKLVARLQALRIVKPLTLDAPNGYLEIDPCVVEIVRQLDDEALRKKAEPPPAPPNRMDQAKHWAFSKWSIVIPLIVLAVLGAIALFVTNMKTILDWFGIKR
jgi:hypothetical protein